ncbi:MAG TPA: NAD+ synthase [Gemmatimonadaceae bacterium]|nr:NAD+ synthase [Gemmatimonadaceae bacterium]
MPSLVHLATVQFKPRKGDYAGSLERLGPMFAQLDALDPRPDIVHFAETALTGYFVEGGVREVAVSAGTLAADLHRAYTEAAGGSRTLDVAIGFYELFHNSLYNSALYVTVGGDAPVIRHVHRKLFLPTYGLFDEERFVDRGLELRAFDTPVGRVAMVVCEDAWHSFVGTIAALDGARILLIHSASPGRGPWPREASDAPAPGPATLDRWDRLARDIAEEHGMYVSIAQLVGSEGGKLLTGGSVVVGPKGDIRARGPVWDEGIVSVSVDMTDVTRARSDMPLLSDFETLLPHMLENVQAIKRGDPVDLQYDKAKKKPAASKAKTAKPEKSKPASNGKKGALKVTRVLERPLAPPPIEIDPELTAEWLVAFLRDEMERRGFEKVVVALSGGVDSACSTYLAARALGPENVIAVRLPYKTSSADSLAHAQLVIDALEIESETIEITDAVDGYLENEPDADAMRRGNVMARMRMIALFDMSAKHGALPIGTGNKTERLFGYFTWHADDTPPINPLGDLLKTQVLTLSRYLGVPEPIVAKPPTADLVQGQTDEGDMGITYAKADEILNWLVSGYRPEEIISRGYDAGEVEVVNKRLSSTHWKRKLPTVAMVSNAAIGESYLRPVDY